LTKCRRVTIAEATWADWHHVQAHSFLISKV